MTDFNHEKMSFYSACGLTEKEVVNSKIKLKEILESIIKKSAVVEKLSIEMEKDEVFKRFFTARSYCAVKILKILEELKEEIFKM